MSTLITRVTPSGPLPVLGAAAVVAVLVGPLSRAAAARRGPARPGRPGRPRQSCRTRGRARRGGPQRRPAVQPAGGFLVEAVGISYAAVTDTRDEPHHVGGPTSKNASASRRLHAGGERVWVPSRWPHLGTPSGSRDSPPALVPHVASVVRTQRLAADLEIERGRALAATIIERERIRSDLHDGLGPTLSGISLGLQAADLSITGDEPVVRAVLRRARDEARLLRPFARYATVLDALGPVVLEDQQVSAWPSTPPQAASASTARRGPRSPARPEEPQGCPSASRRPPT